MFEKIKQLFADKYVPGKIRTYGANSGLAVESDRADWWRERKGDWAEMDNIINPIVEANQRIDAQKRALKGIIVDNRR